MTVSGKIPETRIKDSDALLQILDLLPTSIFVKDENLNFVFSNEAHCRFTSKPGDGASFTAWFPIIETLEEAA